ncbi:MAG TPA: TetR/AcrR family transcriptional regulator [Lachnospiraceae bacterium]|nr:TetR/AcrR family transcriptional regulator [Lachnospiraceae bacterium]
MARPINEENREIIRKRICDAAYIVFCSKGYLKASITDIINEAGMSRGEFYHYFNSVDEVFQLTVHYRRQHNLYDIKTISEQVSSFSELLDDFFQWQRERLLHVNDGMLRSVYEYLFSHIGNENDDFQIELKTNQEHYISEIISYGVSTGSIPLSKTELDLIVEHWIHTIEGLNARAMFRFISAETIDRQLVTLKNMLGTKK